MPLVPILNLESAQIGKIELPKQFNEPIREDLIFKAFRIASLNARQPYGSDPLAGKRKVSKLSRRRRKYKTAYGRGISRVPRKTLARRGAGMWVWVGAKAPSTRGGFEAHPPKIEKRWRLKINKKERRKSIRSALAASFDLNFVSKSHAVPKNWPFVVSDDFENIEKTSKLREILEKLDFKDELKRCSIKKIRAGKGKLRARRVVKRKGPLLVFDKMCKTMLAAKNIPGIETALVNWLNIILLSHGGRPGRLVLFTKSALEKISKEQLYV